MCLFLKRKSLVLAEPYSQNENQNKWLYRGTRLQNVMQNHWFLHQLTHNTVEKIAGATQSKADEESLK